MTEKEKETLYSLIGFMIVIWGIVESTSALITNALYQNEALAKKLPGRPKRMPKFLDQQFAFQRQCSYVKDGPVEKIKHGLLDLLKRTEEMKDLRNKLTHSAFLEGKSSDGLYRFTNLDARDSDHYGTDWELSITSASKYREALLELAAWWNLLAQEAIQLVEGYR